MGKVAVVTGGIRNLGKEISLRLAAERATVVIGSRYPPTGSRDPAEAEKARGEFAAADLLLTRMRRSGGRALWVHTDVARPGSVRALLSETRNRFGRVDLLVNNAGAGGNFSRVGEVMRDHRENFAAVLAANFLGPWEAIVAAREILRTQPGGGSIVNVSTHYADHPYLFRTIYTVSKILLKALTKAARADLAADGISIADVAPTLIAGPRMEWVMRNYATKFSSGFDDFPGLSPAARKVLTDLFLRSFDGALSAEERERPRYRSSPHSVRGRCRKARASGSRRGTTGSASGSARRFPRPRRGTRRWRRRCCSRQRTVGSLKTRSSRSRPSPDFPPSPLRRGQRGHSSPGNPAPWCRPEMPERFIAGCTGCSPGRRPR